MTITSRNRPFSRAQIRELLEGKDDDWLFSRAALATELEFGNEVYLRAIVEFSNYCANQCHYCGLRAANRALGRYRLSTDSILGAVHRAAANDIGSVVLQSGDDSYFRADTIGWLIREIKARHDIAITLSLGERPADELGLWRYAGADRYLLKMETFDRTLFERCRPGADFDGRLKQLEWLAAMGYQVGSGIIVGLPGMTLDTLAADIEALCDLNLDMIACGPFIPHPQTPFAAAKSGDVLSCQRVTALLRLLNPGANIPATSALEVLKPGARLKSLRRGCNVVMPSFTPEDVNANYNIYPGKNGSNGDARARLHALRAALAAEGLVAASCRGDAKTRRYRRQPGVNANSENKTQSENKIQSRRSKHVSGH
ncbi:[FeFe] hydrogenase H-cluster radical SAM maturase HydE [Shewanella sp. JM162201]|uniref:[FeFe] hydrogenase H-cluster radical SAM maturase HydE n=1 Tax=Shewanella jiangmenensis TaxID=2837387 RepID=A0ABS5V313_9GAMM|nr:[FeFe] hydrogenase H-cluster radical SAM maturase HydE [Shewanella jiangmenensis]MBT1444837.1 [FeFe] hydrogenase H-cluster radical SAM maturase HydE [Shewanella jiangmenensis]